MTHSSSSDGPLGYQRVGKACGRSRDCISTKSEASSVLSTILPDHDTSETWDRTCDQAGFADLGQKLTYQCGPDGGDFDLLNDGTQEPRSTPRAELHDRQHGGVGTRNDMQAQSARRSSPSLQQPTTIDRSDTDTRNACQNMVSQTKRKRTYRYPEGTDDSNESIYGYMGEDDNGENAVSGYGNTSDMSPMMEEYFFATTERHERFWNLPNHSTAGDSRVPPEAEAEIEAPRRSGSRQRDH